MFLISIIIVNDSSGRLLLGLMTDFNVYVYWYGWSQRDLWDFLEEKKIID